jgi:protein dithiol:quinone oxidoreductase
MMIGMTPRHYYLSLFLVTSALFVGSLLLQYGFRLEPCALCMIDRVLVFVLAMLYLVACLHQPSAQGQWVYRLLGLCLVALGLFTTGRHLWIMHLPPEQMPSCTPSLEYLIETLPLHEAIMVLFQGSKECGENVRPFLGLSLPAWTFVGFCVIGILNIIPCKKKGRLVATLDD